MNALRTGWWLFRRCAEVCSRLNAYADRVAARNHADRSHPPTPRRVSLEARGVERSPEEAPEP